MTYWIILLYNGCANPGLSLTVCPMLSSSYLIWFELRIGLTRWTKNNVTCFSMTSSKVKYAVTIPFSSIFLVKIYLADPPLHRGKNYISNKRKKTELCIRCFSRVWNSYFAGIVVLVVTAPQPCFVFVFSVHCFSVFQLVRVYLLFIFISPVIFRLRNIS